MLHKEILKHYIPCLFQAFVKCVFGTSFHAFDIFVYGLGLSIVCLLSGCLTRVIKQLTQLVLASVVLATVVMVGLVWTPSEDHTFLVLLVVVLITVPVAVYNTQLSGEWFLVNDY